ncbi:MAG: patatin-like phospholipase family protein [Lapillicoccus sp.]
MSDDTPSGGAEVNPSNAELRARQLSVNQYATTLFAVVILGVILVLVPLRATGLRLPATTLTMLGVLVLLLTGMALVRQGALVLAAHPGIGAKPKSKGPQESGDTGTSAGERPTPEAVAERPLDPPSGTVICCSGGGIKSASFCLGALQYLGEAGHYEKATALVGVSGGGYTAAAYALGWQEVARASAQVEKVTAETTLTAETTPPLHPTPAPAYPAVFGMDSTELAGLRRRTNYLAGSPRVRFELVGSLLLGLVLNSLVLFGFGTVFVWLLAGFDTAMGLPGNAADDQAWLFGDPSTWWWMSLPTLALLAFTVVLFIRDRTQAQDPGKPSRWSARSEPGWWSNLPNSLATLAWVWLLAVPGMTVLAIALHNAWLSHFAGVGAAYAHVEALLATAAATMFGTLLRSFIKGVWAPRGDSFLSPVLAAYRRVVAPAAALGIAGVGLAVVLAGMLAVELTTGSALGPVAWGRGWASWLKVPRFPIGPESWWLPLAGGAALFIARFAARANGTSLHVFYRDSLARAYLDHWETDAYHLPFTDVATADVTGQNPRRGPELVLCGTVNIQAQDVVPTGRNGAPFIMSRGAVGVRLSPDPAPAERTQTSAEYAGRMDHPLTVSAAVAISGAAVAPTAGREVRFRPYRVLFAIANVRLGVWLPNPAWRDRPPGRAWANVLMRLDRGLSLPTGLQVIQEAFATMSGDSAWVYVTDGGHYDNLGLLEALRRRPSHIIMLDGSGDAEDLFPAMAQAIDTARMDQRVTLAFDPRPLIRGAAEFTQKGSIVVEATYPDGETCQVHYIKCVLPEGMPWELAGYRASHPGFPATSSSLEMYDEFDFEAYRHLGYELTRRAGIPGGLGDGGAEQSADVPDGLTRS